jgi:hypothetical protein
METRDAYQQLLKKIQTIGRNKLAIYQNYECSHCCCCCFGLSARQVAEKEALYGPVDPAVVAAHYNRLVGQHKDLPQENCPVVHCVDTDAAWTSEVVSTAVGYGASVMGM